MNRVHKIRQLLIWPIILCGLIGCSPQSPPGLALPFDSAHAEPQPIIEMTLIRSPNMNVDINAASRFVEPMDADSIELFVTETGEKVYHPVFLCNRSLQFIAAFVRTNDSLFLRRAEKYASKLVTLSQDFHGALFAPYSFDHEVHNQRRWLLKAPFHSGMAQGQMLGVMSRLALLTREQSYLDHSHQLFESLTRIQQRDMPWVSRVDTAGYFWIEEFTLEGGVDQTLNGYIAALYGLYDYWNLTKDPRARRMWDASLTTLKRYLPEFCRTGIGSYYCLGHHEGANDEYHRLHISMCRELHRLTGDEFYLEIARRLNSDHPLVDPF
ncbi:MAG: hypothetical protein IPH75_11285 [bacterium]|nr:hypothetical protein [bacterium]